MRLAAGILARLGMRAGRFARSRRAAHAPFTNAPMRHTPSSRRSIEFVYAKRICSAARWAPKSSPGVTATPASSSSARECKAVLREARAARIDVERTLRRLRHLETQLAQGGHEMVAAAPELVAARIQDRERLRREGCKRRELSDRRRRQINVLRKLLDLIDVALRRDHPAQTPARHVEVLREAVDHEKPSLVSKAVRVSPS